MAHDERHFPEPLSFKPERHLRKVQSQTKETNGLNSFDPADPSTLVFGFGRRLVLELRLGFVSRLTHKSS